MLAYHLHEADRLFRNSHFALATHVLAALALHPEGPMTSATLAQSVNTNPAFLRVLLGQLKAAGLIEVTLGKGGGATLKKPPQEIRLADIYRAMEPESTVRLHQCEPDHRCLVGRNIVPVLEEVIDDVEAAALARLEETTLQSLTRKIRKRG